MYTPKRQTVSDIQYAENIPKWIKIHQAAGWTNLEITITDEGRWRLSGVRLSKVPPFTKK